MKFGTGFGQKADPRSLECILDDSHETNLMDRGIGDRLESRMRVDVVGVGPGDLDLLTVRAKRIIQSAPVVAHVRTGVFETVLAQNCCSSVSISGARTRALDTVRHLLNDDQTIVPLDLPMSHDAAMRSRALESAAEACFCAAMENQWQMVLLCLGDPSLYGSWMAICEALRERCAGALTIQVHAGVSAMSAAAAHLKTPLASSRDEIRILARLPSSGSLIEALGEASCVVIHKPSGLTSPMLSNWHSQIKSINARAWLLMEIGFADQQVIALHQSQLPIIPSIGYFSLVLVLRGAHGN